MLKDNGQAGANCNWADFIKVGQEIVVTLGDRRFVGRVTHLANRESRLGRESELSRPSHLGGN
jgi:hypothetical protein